jgi:LuxR family maltose regulon positive regulatory protein
MDSSLLATKLRIPPLTHRTVRRARLIDALEREIPAYKLVQIAAPAGYGKTTLLAQWAQASSLAVAWLTVSEDDNDFVRFFRYLLNAWEEIRPGVSESPLGLLLGAMEPDANAVLTSFITVANHQFDHTVFILDDVHLITDASIHQALTFLLDQSPPTLHFVLAGRGEPSLPLARYRARQELLELRVEDLHFELNETEEFLNRLMELDLSDDDIMSLQTQLEGWIAGLQLVSLTLRRGRDPTKPFVVSGRHRFIADYLTEDVLDQLSDARRQFLLKTSILDRLSGELCNAVTETDDGQGMLESLERDNLFIVPLDDNRQWYRYHPLFADFLRDLLGTRPANEIASLHRRAARWHLSHDLPDQAFRHAIAGNDSELVGEFGERYFEIKLLSGEYAILTHWLDMIPKEWRRDYPSIGIIRAGVLLFTGALEDGVHCLDEVERELSEYERADKRSQLARVHAIRCTIACFMNDLAQAEAFAKSALNELPAADHMFRSAIHHALGDTYRRNGRWDEARAHYYTTLELQLEPAYRIRSVHVFGALADLELQQGRLRNSAAYWRKALAIIEERATWGSFPLPLIGWVFIRLGEILYEWNELEEAGVRISQGLERSELSGDVRTMIAGYLIASRLHLSTGNIEAAESHLDRCRPFVEEAQFLDWTSRFERCRLEYWLAQDRLRAAADWADAMLRGNNFDARPEPEIVELTLARVLMIKEDVPSRERAIALLQSLIQRAEEEGRAGILIEALALQALTEWKRGNRASAMIALERALRLGEPEGYVRLFADLGLPMARLLQEAQSREVMPAYVGKLLAAFGAALTFPAMVEVALPEPLSPREHEVLQLIAAGLTNSEIAEALIISPETVKKHTSNIYSKLGVSHRTEAAARARALHLLE